MSGRVVRRLDTASTTFTDGAGTTLAVEGGTVTFQELPGFDLAPREHEVSLTFSISLPDVSWAPAMDAPPRGMNRAQRRAHRRRA